MDNLTFLTTLCLPSGDTSVIPTNGLKVWLDADDTTTITTVSGVSQWVDKSGTGNTVVQETEAAQPAYVAAAQNNRGVIRFNGSSHYLAKTTPIGGLVGFSAATCFVVDIADTSTSTDAVVTCFESQGDQRTWQIIRPNGSAGRFLDTSTSGTGTTTRSEVGGLQAWTITYFTFNTTSQTLSRTGTTADTDLTGAALFNGTSPLYVGVGDPVDGGFWDGDIAEIIFYNRVLSAREIEQVVSYLTIKWGIA